MAADARVLIVGAYGVFGRLLARELLATTDAKLVLAGRDEKRLADLSPTLRAGDRAIGLGLDVNDPDAVTRAARDCAIVICAAGPFASLSLASVAATIASGAHWLDIADDAAWIDRLLRDPNLTAIEPGGPAVGPGLSTVPSLCGALVGWCRARMPDVSRARVTLFIGNRSAKGAGAIESALSAGLERPGAVELVLGSTVTTYSFDFQSPVLLAGGPGVEAELRVAFESGLGGRLLATLARVTRRWPPEPRRRLARFLANATAPIGWLGSDVSCLQAEAWNDAGRRIRAALVSRGQRMAIFPCALVAQMLLRGESRPTGPIAPAYWLTPDEWIGRLEARGLRFVDG